MVEIVPATGKPLECDSEGFFNWDNDSFEDGLLDETVKLLSFSRQDLLRLIDGVSDDVLDARLTQGKRTIREIVDHIAIAEWWYTTRLAADPSRARPWSEYGADVLSRLNEIRNMFLHEFVPMLRRMSDRERQQVFEHRGERWTAKKVLRRAVWHELLHLKQLYRLVPKVVSAVW
ncbi:MAG: DinB family protein [Alicyclobacillus macrosporangiidus]|uniref:DinB family protein n=1 Tax=Alicyclobacillus macrosporangiidus TaxID=392015 RepID=UPI0026F03692|nr:DinB family protein [Alicyclobacillus macrosporangiidus]MCL6600319.1 DinB family protein [Alicyclobacillus macrosporangiidus]